MELNYQITKKDFTDFNKLYCKEGLQKRLPVVIILIVLAGITFGSEPFHLMRFLVGTTISAIVVFGFYYFIPLYRANITLNKVLAKEELGLENRKLTIIDEGLLIESENKTTTWLWESITSVQSNQLFVYLFLSDKRYMLFPKRYFPNENEVVNFMGLIQSKVIQKRGWSNLQVNTSKSKPPYLLGLLCLIPMVGAFVGFGLLMYGIFKYKDKWLIIIGIAGIIWTVAVYGSLSYQFKYGTDTRKGFASLSQMQLNSLLKNIEFYKIQHGNYPDSLGQISEDDKMAGVNDPLRSLEEDSKKGTKYNYQRVGNHYYLFSSGIDGIPNTKDDLYPQVAPTDSAKFGLLIKRPL
jgi:hypothetical protein